MESKLSKQISSYCRLNFSNQLVKQPKPLFYPKNIPQKPILFKKKCQKKSLKYLNNDQILNLTKNPSKQPNFSRKNSLRKNLTTQSPNQRLSSEKLLYNFQFKYQTDNHFIHSLPESKLQVYKSLERQPSRKPEPKRNLIQQLKNYQIQKNDPLKNSQPLSRPFIPKFLVQRQTANLNKSATFFMPRSNPQNPQDEIKWPVFGPIPNQNILPPRTQTSQSPIKYFPTVNFSPSRSGLASKSSNLTLSSPLKLSKIPTLQKTPILCVSEPHLIKRAAQNINLTLQKDSISYSEKFNNIFGEVNIEDDLKEDLIASIEFQPTKSNFENNTAVPSFIKPSESEKSTFINSESKLRKFNSESDFFETIDLTKKSQFGHPTRTESIIRAPHDESYKNHFFSPQIRRLETFKNDEQNDMEGMKNEQIRQMTQKEEFREKCERRENFRSIISVHSECETSSESEDSIIIDNHPKELISTRPIRTLF